MTKTLDYNTAKKVADAVEAIDNFFGKKHLTNYEAFSVIFNLLCRFQKHEAIDDDTEDGKKMNLILNNFIDSIKKSTFKITSEEMEEIANLKETDRTII